MENFFGCSNYPDCRFTKNIKGGRPNAESS